MAEAVEVAAWLAALPCAPEFRPTEAEFADPVAYISKIEAEARTFGICKIIPPFPRASKRTALANLNRSLLLQTSHSSSSSSAAQSSSALEPELCRSMGGCMPPQKFHRRSVCGCASPPFPHSKTRTTPPSFLVDGDGELKAKFNTRRQQLGCSTGKRSKVPVDTFAQKLVWQSGESYTLELFEAKAKQFARTRLKTSKDLSPFAIESLFWKAAADRTITVEYGNDIPGSAFGEPTQLAAVDPTILLKRKWSFGEKNLDHQPAKERKLDDSGLENVQNDFCSSYQSGETASSCGTPSNGKPSLALAKERLRPRRKMGRADFNPSRAGSELANSFWNMQVMPRAPGSLLRYMPDEVPGVTSPMVYIGMLFSWFAWHVEDHELHSLNYLHIGAPKTWYAVPGDAAPALEEVVRVYGYGNCLDAKASFTLLGEKTTVMSPEVLLAAGVPCCRLVQNAGEFVVTFPRAYHLGFSHGFNCGEAANFASPAWLEVAKDAATRRASMNYLPMLSHQHLLYLLALSFFSSVPRALAFEGRSSRSKGTMLSVREEAVKTVFANDAAYNNRLLGLLLDCGVMGCVLINDGTVLSSAPFEHSKLSCSAANNGDKDLSTSSVMHEMLLEDPCAAESAKKYFGSPEVRGTLSQDLKHFVRSCDPPMTRRLSFCWGTLPCAACGLLCFPSMVLVQPVSNIGSSAGKSLASAEQHSNVDSSRLPSFVAKAEDGHVDDQAHLESNFLMPNEGLQSAYIQVSLSEAIYQPETLAKAEENPLLWKMKHGCTEGLEESSNDSSGKSSDFLFSKKMGKANAIQHEKDEIRQSFGRSFTHQEAMLSNSVAIKTANEVSSDELSSVLQGKVLSQGSCGNVIEAGLLKTQTFSNISDVVKNVAYQSSSSILEGCASSSIVDNLMLVDSIESAGRKATETGSATSVLDLLAVTYNDESEDSGLRIKIKPSLPFVDHGGIFFHHHHSSLRSDEEVDCTVDTLWHPMKKEAENSSSLDDVSKLQSLSSSFPSSCTELDKFLLKGVFVQSGDCSFLRTDCLPKEEPCHGVPIAKNIMSKDEMKDNLAVVLNSVKEEHSFIMQDGQPGLGMPIGVKEQFLSLDKALQATSQLGDDSKGADYNESMKALDLPVVNHFCNLGPYASEIKDVSEANVFDGTVRQVKATVGSCHMDSPILRSDACNSGQACSHDIGNASEGQAADCLIPKDENNIIYMCSDGIHNSHASSANLDSSANWMHNEALSIFDRSSTLEMDSKNPSEDTEMRLKSKAEDMCMQNVGIWMEQARDCSCPEAPHYDHLVSANTPPKPRFMCPEHALEAHHHLKQRGGSRMLIICHSDIAKIERYAQHCGQDSSVNHIWKEIPYSEATQGQKQLIDVAIKAEEEREDGCEDWVAQFGMSVWDCENTALPDIPQHGANLISKARTESPSRLDDVVENEARATHKKEFVAGNWCGKIWMSNQVHPALGGCHTAYLHLQALQNTGRDCMDDMKALSAEQILTGTFKTNVKCRENSCLINNHINVDASLDSMLEIERINQKTKAVDFLMNVSQEEIDSRKGLPIGNKCGGVQGDVVTVDSSCHTKAARRKEEPVNFSNQIHRDDCCTLQSSNGNTSNSLGESSQVSDVAGFERDASEMDIWQDFDVGCYSQEVLSLDTMGGTANPLTVETCPRLDAEVQEDFIPGMLRRSCSPFDCSVLPDFFLEGPSTRLRSRNFTKPLSIDYDDEDLNVKHNEASFSSGKRRKQPRQKSKKSVMKDLEEECGAYVCELDGCSMSFSSKHELSLHKRNSCTFAGCGKRFGSHKYLLQHRRVHLDDRPLKCPWKGCKMTFKWKWACTEHYRVHTGERPYVCPIPECGRTFRFVSDFSRHKRKTGHTK